MCAAGFGKALRQAFSPLWSYSLIGRIDVSGGEKVLKLDRPLGRRVLRFDSGCTAEGCGGRLQKIKGRHYDKTFTTALAGEEMRSPFGGFATTFPPQAGAQQPVLTVERLLK